MLGGSGGSSWNQCGGAGVVGGEVPLVETVESNGDGSVWRRAAVRLICRRSVGMGWWGVCGLGGRCGGVRGRRSRCGHWWGPWHWRQGQLGVLVWFAGAWKGGGAYGWVVLGVWELAQVLKSVGGGDVGEVG